MRAESFFSSAFPNVDFIDELYEKYQEDPSSVDAKWRQLFDSVGSQATGATVAFDDRGPPSKHDDLRILKLINAYRTYGHLLAKINPIQTHPTEEPWQLKLDTLGFSEQELSHQFSAPEIMGRESASLQEIINTLKAIYCGNIGIEYMGIQDLKLERWIQERIEPKRFKVDLSIDQKRMILQHLNRSELFEVFLHTKYVGQKRFSLEGGETLIPILATIIEVGADEGIEQFVLGMAHRGRLNVLSNILNKSYGDIFGEFEDRWLPNSFEGSGDVKYHKGFSSIITTHDDKNVEVDLTPNPSHLEAVNPVVEGQVKAKQVFMRSDQAQKKVVPVLIHGDAALSGQGIIYEVLQMYGLKGYSTGGTLHVVINNQIGFTTLPKDGRSTPYCTDIARAFCAPVFHVNAEDPESCIYATILAVTIRQKFHCDVFIDLNCYRKYGHNESDEPAFTQPLEYNLIRGKKSIREIYRDDLIHQGVLEKHMAEALEVEFKEALQEALHGSRYSDGEVHSVTRTEDINVRTQTQELEMLRAVPTGVSNATFMSVGEKICVIPPEFTAHRKIEQLVSDRLAMIHGEKPIDWGMGELLAYGTLLWEGVDVRLAGQDCGRGTFSHRHAIWMDQIKEQTYCSLQHLKTGQGRFDVINSLLSEYAALGFEFGYSLAALDSLVLWEAQFGDFANGAQVMIDQFIASSEQKWGQKNNLVMLLPHGYEGQGPEHSSGRLERFLQLAADNNMFVVNPTLPSQLFHLLRRQVLRHSPKPLIVFTPKALLRLPECVSAISDFTHGSFEEVLDDPKAGSNITTLVFCSGKIYYDLIAERNKRGADQVAFVRIEQLYPLQRAKLKSIIGKYAGCKHCIWAQEEPKNMGAWQYIKPHLQELLPHNLLLKYIGREASAASATGSHKKHKQQYEAFINQLFM
jgi:2-oxoglutarate dehydrogenase E1 component